MSLNSLADVAGGFRQIAQVQNKSGATAVPAGLGWTEYITASNGSPGAGSLTVSTVGDRLSVDNTRTGAIALQDFTGSTGRITRIECSATAACRVLLLDVLEIYGTIAFNTDESLSAPSIAARLPDNCEAQAWVVVVATMTGVLTLDGRYVNQAGVTTQILPTFALPSGALARRAFLLPLAAGDCSIEGLTHITGTIASAGTYDVLIARPLWQGRVDVINAPKSYGLEEIGAPIVYPTSCLALFVNADTTTNPAVSLDIEIAAG